MTGFRDEKEMWKFEKPRLRGRNWQRYELIFPDGHPDVKGSFGHRIIYIENKVAEIPSHDALRPSQKEHIEWLVSCGEEVWIAFGSSLFKRIRFVRAKGEPPEFWEQRVPEFWSPTKLRP